MFYYILYCTELRIEAVNVGHLNIVRNVPWASAAMNVVFPILSLFSVVSGFFNWYPWLSVFLNYNIGELQVTSEVNIVPVSTAFFTVRFYGNKIYFKLLECTELCNVKDALTSHVHKHSEGYG